MDVFDYLDLEDFRERVDGDEELMADIFRIFLDEVGEHVAAIEKAFREKDLGKMKSASHALKGMAANISAKMVRENAFSLERLAETGDDLSISRAIDDLKKNINNTVNFLNHYLKDGGVL